MDIGKIDRKNPSPFKQPFLVLGLTPERSTHEWVVDVNGRVDLYLKGGAHKDEYLNREGDATELLKQTAVELRKHGIFVHKVGTYEGSAGPTHILRNGVFFARMKTESACEVPRPSWMDK